MISVTWKSFVFMPRKRVDELDDAVRCLHWMSKGGRIMETGAISVAVCEVAMLQAVRPQFKMLGESKL